MYGAIALSDHYTNKLEPGENDKEDVQYYGVIGFRS